MVNHAFLPAISLLIATIGTWILTMRNTMITTLAEDYVRMARAKGLPNRRIMLDYAARNAILPNLTGFAMSLGFVVSGAILIEYVFNYPGVGFMLLQAVSSEDYPLMQGLFLLITGGQVGLLRTLVLCVVGGLFGAVVAIVAARFRSYEKAPEPAPPEPGLPPAIGPASRLEGAPEPSGSTARRRSAPSCSSSSS